MFSGFQDVAVPDQCVNLMRGSSTHFRKESSPVAPTNASVLLKVLCLAGALPHPSPPTLTRLLVKIHSGYRYSLSDVGSIFCRPLLLLCKIVASEFSLMHSSLFLSAHVLFLLLSRFLSLPFQYSARVLDTSIIISSNLVRSNEQEASFSPVSLHL